jgi:hypothetical protein
MVSEPCRAAADAVRSCSLASTSAAAGSMIRMVVPPPGSLSIAMCPPVCVTTP